MNSIVLNAGAFVAFIKKASSGNQSNTFVIISNEHNSPFAEVMDAKGYYFNIPKETIRQATPFEVIEFKLTPENAHGV